MKKSLIFILVATIFILSGCFMQKKSQPTDKPVISESSQATPSITASPKNDAQKATEATSKKDGLIKGEGSFLGMDDSNSLVIIEKSGDKVAEARYQIAKELNFENSNIEIGQSVEFYYKTEKNGIKVIQKISKK
jgi:hypothetical protein